MPAPEKFTPLPFTPVLPALAMLTTIFLAGFLARTLFGPLLLPVSETLGLGLAACANIFICLSCGYSLTVLCAGFLSQRLGHKATLVLSISLIGFSLLGLSVSQTFWQFACGAALMGAGSGLYMPSSVATITEITPSAHWSQAFAIHELAPNLALVAGPLLAELFLRSSGFSNLFLTLGLICLGLALLYALRGPRTLRPGVAPGLSNVSLIIVRPAFWMTTLLFLLTMGAEVGMYNLIPAFLVAEKGVSRESANIILGCSRTLSILFLPTSGWIMRRIGYRRTLSLCLMGTGLTAMLAGYGPLWWSVTMLCLQPIFIVCFFPVGFAALSLVCPRSMNDLAVSLAITCASIGGSGLVPALLARCGETYSFALAFTLFGLVSCAAGLAAFRKLEIPKE